MPRQFLTRFLVGFALILLLGGLWHHPANLLQPVAVAQAPSPYEVGAFDLNDPNLPANHEAITDAFRAAYQRNEVTSQPSSYVHLWAGAWIQDFPDASLLYNPETGSAYYLEAEYVRRYVQAGGPVSFLGLPISDRFDPPEGSLLLDENRDFTQNPVQFFQFGFIGKDSASGEYLAMAYFPVIAAGRLEVNHEPDPSDPEKVKARVTLTVQEVESNPPLNDRVPLDGIWVESDNPAHRGWIPEQGTGSWIRAGLDITDTFSFRLGAWTDGQAGYYPCDSAKNQREEEDYLYSISLDHEDTYALTYDCVGIGGGGGTIRDTEAPIISEPTSWQNGWGWAVIDVQIKDNIAVASATISLNDVNYALPLQGGNSRDGVYSRIVPLQQGENAYYVTAQDRAGNSARYPADGTLLPLKSVMSAMQGYRPWMGYSDDPVNSGIGNFIYSYTDFDLPALGPDLTLERWFNHQSEVAGLFGIGWTTTYDMRLTIVDNLLLNGAQLRYPDGHTVNFERAEDGILTATYPTQDRLEQQGDAYLLTTKERLQYQFDSTGKLVRVADEDDNALTLLYADERLVAVTDATGRTLHIEYQGERVVSVSIPDYGTLTYSYDQAGRLLGATDVAGNQATYHYDGQGCLQRITSPEARPFLAEQACDEQGRISFQRGGAAYINEFVYDEEQRTTTILDPYGNQTVHIYDEEYRLIESRDALGRATHYTYGEGFSPLTITDKNGHTSSYTYDGRGNTLSITDPLGHVTAMTYDEANRLLSRTDALGHTTRYEYDAQGHLTREIDALGGVKEHSYNEAGLRISTVDELGRRTETTYNAQGLPSQLRDALGHITTMTYDGAGRLLTQTDALGYTTTYTYNEVGLVETITDPEGYTLRYEYDADEQLVREIRWDGATREYTYDESGHRVTESDWAGFVTTHEYDDLSRKVADVDPLGQRVSYEYDAASNLVTQHTLGGGTVHLTYDGEGNLLTESDPLGNVTSYDYDPLGRPIRVSRPCDCAERIERTLYDALGRAILTIDALGYETHYDYDALGRLIKVTDALGHETHRRYDTAGNLISELDSLGQETRYEYDALNRLVRMTDRTGAMVTQAYDAAGRRVSRTDERGYTTIYHYDGNGRLIREVDALGHTTQQSYDGSGNRLAETDALGRVTTRAYDANGNLLQLTNPRGFTTSYEYDVLNRRTRMGDALGGGTTYSYDPAGNSLSETNPVGYTRTMTYDAAGHLLTETNHNGHTTTYRYDAAGNVIEIEDALGGVTRYSYDANNQKHSETNALGFTTRYEYDALGRQSVVIDALAGRSIRHYDPLGRLTAVINARGFMTSYEYDAEGRQTARRDALGQSRHYRYDAAGNLVEEVDRNGYATRHEYDAIGRKVATTNALGHRQTTEYDAVANVVAITSYRGLITRYEYDPNNHVVTQIDALGGQTRSVYDELNRLISVTDANDHTALTEYDAVGNILATTLPEGQRTTHTYDGEGNRLTTTSAEGHTTAYAYDALNRVVMETDPLGHLTTLEYDAIGQVVRRTDANNHATTNRYDALGRLVTVTDPLGHTTAYSYDAVGNRLTKRDANGHTNSYQYDALDRLVLERNPVGSEWHYTFDPEGNLVAQVDANHQLTRYTFDAVNRMVGIDYPTPQSDVSYSYDANGNLSRMVDGLGTTRFVYDELDRERSKVDPYGRTLVTTYDAVGNRLSLTYPNGNRVVYGYNANDWLTTMTDPRGGHTHYRYTNDGQVSQTTYPNLTRSERSYDQAGRLIRLVNRAESSGRIITAYAYTLDAVGNRTRVEEQYTQGQTRTNLERYTYNARDELVISVEVYAGAPGATVTTTYNYDAVGNRTRMTTARVEGPRPPATQTRTFAYDAADRLITADSTQYTYDANGNRTSRFMLTTPASQTRLERYEYDVANRLVQYTRQRAQTGHVEQRLYHTYDGLGRRLGRGAQNGAGTVKWTLYAVDGRSYDQLAEYPQTGQPRATELYRGLGNALVSMDQPQGGGGAQYWFAADGLGSVAALTKQSGQSAHEYFYDPYGQLLDENGHWEDSSSWTNPHNHYLLNGKEWDEESRLYYFGARFYDAEVGLWLNADPYRGEVELPTSLHPYLYLGQRPPAAGDHAHDPMRLHRYLYNRNNPVNRVDPLGFFNWYTSSTEPGDTINQIAEDAGVSIADITSWNRQLCDQINCFACINEAQEFYASYHIWLPIEALTRGVEASYTRDQGGYNGAASKWSKRPPNPPEYYYVDNRIVSDWVVDLIGNVESAWENSSTTEMIEGGVLDILSDHTPDWVLDDVANPVLDYLAPKAAPRKWGIGRFNMEPGVAQMALQWALTNGIADELGYSRLLTEAELREELLNRNKAEGLVKALLHQLRERHPIMRGRDWDEIEGSDQLVAKLYSGYMGAGNDWPEWEATVEPGDEAKKRLGCNDDGTQCEVVSRHRPK